MTLTLTSVFAPLAFATGRTGRLFIEFALTLAGAVLVSGFVALTLSPMMCSLLLKHEEKHSWIFNLVESWLTALTNGYRRALTAVLHARWVVVVAWVAVLGAGAVLFMNLKSELSPLEDRGVILGIVTAAQGSTAAIHGRPDQADRAVLRAGAGNGRLDGHRRLPDRRRRRRRAAAEAVGGADAQAARTSRRELRPIVPGHPGSYRLPLNPHSPRSSPPTLDADRIRRNGPGAVSRAPGGSSIALMEEARKFPGIQNLADRSASEHAGSACRINRDKVLGRGRPPSRTVGRTLETMLGGRPGSRASSARASSTT
jgi:multidrug efflux pump